MQIDCTTSDAKGRQFNEGKVTQSWTGTVSNPLHLIYRYYKNTIQ